MVLGKPLISVIMPAYNAESYIKEAIESILIQTYPHFELLICDDGSTDHTCEVIKSIKDERILVFKNEKNLGNLKTTNFLFSKCKGEFITIQDADDYSLPNRFEMLVNAFDSEKDLDMIGSNYMAVNSDKTPIFSGFLPLNNQEIRGVAKKEVVPMLYASVMIRAHILKKVGGFRIFFNRLGYADFDWMARCMEVASKVKNLQVVLYVYRKHSNSFTSNKKKHPFIEMFHPLIVEMHIRRQKNQEDYFETNNLVKMKQMVSSMYLKKAETTFWDQNRIMFPYIWKSIIFNPMNIDIYRTLLYMTRNRKWKK